MRKIVLTLVALLFVAAPVAYAQDPATLAGNWLANYQNDEGSYDNDFFLTSLAIAALASVGQQNEAALDWLESNVSDELDLSDASMGIIAVLAAGEDVGSFAEGNLLGTYTALLRAERGEHIDGLCLGLVARHNLGIPLPETAIAALVNFQNEDGGYSDELAGPSNVLATSLCIHVLAVTEEAEALENALDYLDVVQLDDDGWSYGPENNISDPVGTAIATQALIAADETLSDWGSPERTLFGFLDAETGAFVFDTGSENLTALATAFALPVFRGKSLNSFAIVAESEDSVENEDTIEGPALDQNWKLVGDGFGMEELDTADDFFVTVVDPFTDEELYGIEIINWTAEYQYTGYIVEQYMTAEILNWMAEQDPATWEHISVSTLNLLSEDELVQLPEDIQALVEE